MRWLLYVFVFLGLLCILWQYVPGYSLRFLQQQESPGAFGQINDLSTPSPDEGKVEEQRKLNITLLLAWWPTHVLSNMTENLRDLIMTNRQCYARMHSYSFVAAGDINIDKGNGPKAGYWAKLGQALQLLTPTSGVDWLFYADMDFFITQFDRPLESFIPHPSHGDYHLIVPQELPGQRRFSNFNFLLKNSPEGRAFLDLWVEELHTGCNPQWPDQVAMWRAVMRWLDPHIRDPRSCEGDQGHHNCCRLQCDEPMGGLMVEECYERSMATLCPTDHLTAEYGRCPPVLFTPRLAGLGLQAALTHEWYEMSDSALQESFGIHCKPHNLFCRVYNHTVVHHENGTCEVALWKARPSGPSLITTSVVVFLLVVCAWFCGRPLFAWARRTISGERLEGVVPYRLFMSYYLNT